MSTCPIDMLYLKHLFVFRVYSLTQCPTRRTTGPSSPPSSPSSPTSRTDPSSILPLVDASTPSFGPFSHLLHTKTLKRLSGSHAEQTAGSSLPVPVLHQLRPQKSTSFEHTRRSDDSQSTIPCRPTGIPARKAFIHSRKASGGRPTITVSAPPEAEDRQHDVTPRASRLPRSPPASQSSAKSSKRNAREASEALSSDGSRSPSPPSSMPFPAPPGSRPVRADEASSSIELEFASKRSSISAGSVSSMHGRPVSILKPQTSCDRLSQRRASAVPPQGARVAVDVVSDDDGHKSAPEPRTRTALPRRAAPPTTAIARAGPTAGTSPASGVRTSSTSPPRSRLPFSAASSIQSRGKLPTPLLTGFRRSRGGPPTDPLPSPPPSAPSSVRSVNRTADEYQSDSGASLSTMPSIPSIASTRVSVGQVHQLLFRHRAGTVASLASTSTGSGTLASSGSGPLMPDREYEAPSPPSPLREQFLSDHRVVQPARTRTSFHEDTEEPQAGGQLATVEQLREALSAQSAKYQRLSSYLLNLSERHAVEKSELMGRIETLEKEARKREREIAGLRWLVMNAGSGNAAAGKGKEGQSPEKPSPVTKLRERIRSQSVSNGQGSQKGGRKTGTLPERALSTDSHGDAESMEEGLLEMQESVSDLIAPLQPSPAASDAVASLVVGRMRRSKTWSLSGAFNGQSASSTQQKRPRRTSSPTLPRTVSGLGISVGDLPSIPSLPESELGHDSPMTSPSETAVSIPSLATMNTASSGLSAIPEAPPTPVRASMETDARKMKDVDRRRSKTESAMMSSPHIPHHHVSNSSISSASSSSASGSYASNLKIGASPSIGQVLDYASGSDSADKLHHK